MRRRWSLAFCVLSAASCTNDFDALAGPGEVDGGAAAEDASAEDANADVALVDASAGDASAGDASAGDAATDATGPDTAPKPDATPPCTEAGAKTFEGHCYFPTPGTANWNTARSECASAGAHLVTITSAAEQTLVATLRAGENRWIGLERPKGSPTGVASFKWITGESVGYQSWGSGEPSGSGECGRLRSDGAWADTNCKTAYRAICERE